MCLFYKPQQKQPKILNVFWTQDSHKNYVLRYKKRVPGAADSWYQKLDRTGVCCFFFFLQIGFYETQFGNLFYWLLVWSPCWLVCFIEHWLKQNLTAAGVINVISFSYVNELLTWIKSYRFFWCEYSSVFGIKSQQQEVFLFFHPAFFGMNAGVFSVCVSHVITEVLLDISVLNITINQINLEL